MVDHHAYPIGSTVTFGDTGTVIKGRTAIACGIINGDVIDGSPIDTVYVPVWCDRDGDEKGSTIYVDARNIIEVSE